MPFDGTEFKLPAITTMLMAGRDTILRCGWVQHFTRTWSGVCIVGSLSDYTHSQFQEAAAFLLDAIEDLGYGQSRSLPAFNDAPGRTLGQVIAVYDRAIELSSEERL
jgi:hypothetical protein